MLVFPLSSVRPLVLAAACLALCLARTAHAEEPPKPPSGVLSWPEEEQKKIDAIVKKTVKNPQGFWCAKTAAAEAKSDASAQVAAEACHFLSCFAGSFPQIFPVPSGAKAAIKLVAVVHANRESFVKAIPEARNQPKSLGVFERNKGVVHAVVQPGATAFGAPEQAKMRGTLVHETTHMINLKIAKAIGADFPCVDEGVAIYCESYCADKDIWRLGKEEASAIQMRGLRTLQIAYGKAPELPKLEPLLHATQEQFMAPAQQLQNYALTESLMAFLLATPDGRKVFADIWKAAQGGRKGKGKLLPDAQLAKTEKEWHDWLRQEMANPAQPAGAARLP
jgi:hypothetical protein